MATLDPLDWDILNATADDWENLEQIYRALCWEAVSNGNGDKSAAGVCYRPIAGAPLLEQIADRIRRLTAIGLLRARPEDANSAANTHPDRLVWSAWFEMSPAGREAWRQCAATASG